MLLGWGDNLIVKFEPVIGLIWPDEAEIMALVERPTVDEDSMEVVQMSTCFSTLLGLLL
jgi:hypothetical protein